MCGKQLRGSCLKHFCRCGCGLRHSHGCQTSRCMRTLGVRVQHLVVAAILSAQRVRTTSVHILRCSCLHSSQGLRHQPACCASCTTAAGAGDSGTRLQQLVELRREGALYWAVCTVRPLHAVGPCSPAQRAGAALVWQFQRAIPAMHLLSQTFPLVVSTHRSWLLLGALPATASVPQHLGTGDRQWPLGSAEVLVDA